MAAQLVTRRHGQGQSPAVQCCFLQFTAHRRPRAKPSPSYVACPLDNKAMSLQAPQNRGRLSAARCCFLMLTLGDGGDELLSRSPCPPFMSCSGLPVLPPAGVPPAPHQFLQPAKESVKIRQMLVLI